MRSIKTLLISILIIGCLHQLNAQKKFAEKISYAWYRAIANLRPTPWVVGLGWNIVDDDGNPYQKIFSGKTLNIYPVPTTIRIEKFVDKGWSAVFNFAYNNYKKGKLINSDVPATYSSNFMSFDLNAKYNFCALYDINKKWFQTDKQILDLYTTFGLGYTYRNTFRVNSGSNLNLGFGTNVWIYNDWGINLQAVAKFGLKSPMFDTPSNYLQYSFGAVHIFKMNNGKKTKHTIKSMM